MDMATRGKNLSAPMGAEPSISPDILKKSRNAIISGAEQFLTQLVPGKPWKKVIESLARGQVPGKADVRMSRLLATNLGLAAIKVMELKEGVSLGHLPKIAGSMTLAIDDEFVRSPGTIEGLQSIFAKVVVISDDTKAKDKACAALVAAEDQDAEIYITRRVNVGGKKSKNPTKKPIAELASSRIRDRLAAAFDNPSLSPTSKLEAIGKTPLVVHFNPHSQSHKAALNKEVLITDLAASANKGYTAMYMDVNRALREAGSAHYVDVDGYKIDVHATRRLIKPDARVSVGKLPLPDGVDQDQAWREIMLALRIAQPGQKIVNVFGLDIDIKKTVEDGRGKIEIVKLAQELPEGVTTSQFLAAINGAMEGSEKFPVVFGHTICVDETKDLRKSQKSSMKKGDQPPPICVVTRQLDGCVVLAHPEKVIPLDLTEGRVIRHMEGTATPEPDDFVQIIRDHLIPLVTAVSSCVNMTLGYDQTVPHTRIVELIPSQNTSPDSVTARLGPSFHSVGNAMGVPNVVRDDYIRHHIQAADAALQIGEINLRGANPQY